jgi:hypothetical protein
MAWGEPGIKTTPFGKRLWIIIGIAVVLFSLTMLATAVITDTPSTMTWPQHDAYRIRWNPCIPKAIVQVYTNVGIGQNTRWRDLTEYRGLDEANKHLDSLVEARKAEEYINSQWKIVREEK